VGWKPGGQKESLRSPPRLIPKKFAGSVTKAEQNPVRQKPEIARWEIRFNEKAMKSPITTGMKACSDFVTKLEIGNFREIHDMKIGPLL
jgi:hypothetical protein